MFYHLDFWGLCQIFEQTETDKSLTVVSSSDYLASVFPLTATDPLMHIYLPQKLKGYVDEQTQVLRLCGLRNQNDARNLVWWPSYTSLLD